jgi:hypothetical protein
VSGISLVGEEMRRWGVVILLICSGVWAEDIVAYPPLFATVLDVAENDRLNVRADADYRSAKVASLPNGGYILIDGKGNCNYVIECQGGKCDLVVDYIQDEECYILSD